MNELTCPNSNQQTRHGHDIVSHYIFAQSANVVMEAEASQGAGIKKR